MAKNLMPKNQEDIHQDQEKILDNLPNEHEVICRNANHLNVLLLIPESTASNDCIYLLIDLFDTKTFL